jgi:predicted RNA-binding Zn-ribbon protein involved in translation (DUF1610 family)
MMARVVALRCPNCGAFLERGQMKCQYCGAELILLPDGSSFRFRSEMVCPNCGAINERSSWFCVSCNTILTKDVEMLKELQRKIRFEQERAKTFMPLWMREKIGPDEYIYFVFKIKEDDFYAVTDKRLIKNKHGRYEEASLSEVVGISPIQTRAEPGVFAPKVTGFFEVNTFHGTIIFDGFSVQDAQYCGIFHSWVNIALNNHNTRKKDVRALILKLPLDRKQI